MSLIGSIVMLLAIYALISSIRGNNNSNNFSATRSEAEKDIERLREIADYERWEAAGRTDSRHDMGSDK